MTNTCPSCLARGPSLLCWTHQRNALVTALTSELVAHDRRASTRRHYNSNALGLLLAAAQRVEDRDALNLAALAAAVRREFDPTFPPVARFLTRLTKEF